MTDQTIEDGRTHAIISYITIFGTIISLFLNKDKKNTYASFHIRQAFGIWATWAAFGLIVGQLDSRLVSLVFLIIMICLTIYGFINAVVGIAQVVPIMGNFYQKLFSSLG